jgi:Sec-independent protein secretion pathway component TatC
MELGNSISILFCIPFLGMLLSIAVFPLVKPEWWEHNRKYAVIIWSLLFLIPFAIKYGWLEISVLRETFPVHRKQM